jgi:hypothetical protein
MLLPLVALKPAVGDQLYEEAPVAVNKIEEPGQMVILEGLTRTCGKGLINTL